jgi:hypothetical protein
LDGNFIGIPAHARVFQVVTASARDADFVTLRALVVARCKAVNQDCPTAARAALELHNFALSEGGREQDDLLEANR